MENPGQWFSMTEVLPPTKVDIVQGGKLGPLSADCTLRFSFNLSGVYTPQTVNNLS